LIPIRRATFEKDHALEVAEYFRTLVSVACEVLIIDGSQGIGRDWFEGGRIAAKMAARPHT